jgi:hypothetical protein
MKNTIKKYIAPIVCLVILGITVSSCSKDKYYQDGGVANPNFNGTILQYLQSNPKFDTIAQIVKLAGMEDILSKESVTFFAPTDEVIRRTIGLVNSTQPYVGANNSLGLNQQLFILKKDTIKKLSDISGVVWRKYMMRYIFKGKYLLKDYPQLDFSLRPLYPGGYYYGYNGDLANIGVIFNTANTVKYSGYRQLCITGIADASNPQNYYNGVQANGAAAVASSDIQPTNGVVHVLSVYVTGANSMGDIRLDANQMNLFGMNFDFDNEVILNR